MKSLGLLFFALLFSITSSVNWYNLVIHDQDRGAACLDSSAPGMYINEGSEQNKDKFLIYFTGIGHCGGQTLNKMIQSCYQRSTSIWGSSRSWPDKYDLEGNGIMSTLQKENPNFYDWTKVYVLYCDGAEHQGYRQNPVIHKGKQIYFRGSRNTLEHFYYLDKNYDFYNKDTIVIAGSSAGGLAAFQWVQYLHENTKTSKVYALPDSGLIFMNYTSPITKKQNFRKEVGVLLNFIGQDLDQLPKPVKMCYQKIHDLPSCYDASLYAQFIEAPMFLIESPYDSWGITNQVEAKCFENITPPYSLQNCNKTALVDIEKYRETMIQALHKIRGNRKNIGVWGPACVQYCFLDKATYASKKYMVPDQTGLQLYEAVSKFLKDPENAPWLLDEGKWPSNNTGCNGLNHQSLISE